MKLSEIYADAMSGAVPADNADIDTVRDFLIAKGYDKRNFYQEMEMDSKWVDVHNDISYHIDTIRLHSHVFYELILCQSGKVQYILGDRRYRLEKNDVVLIPPGFRHRPLFLEDLNEPYQRTVMWLDAEFVAAAMRSWPEVRLDFAQDGFVFRTGGASNTVTHIVKHMLDEATQRHPAWRMVLSGEALQLLTHLSRIYHCENYSPPPAESGSLLDDVLHYIDRNLTEKITLDSLARQFLVSKSSVSHLFSDQLGIGCYHYVVQHRLIAAKNEIFAHTTMNGIPEICGFADYSSFYRLFKKEYGISPQEYRKTIAIQSDGTSRL